MAKKSEKVSDVSDAASKKKVSMRESAAKSRAKAEKPRRVRRAAEAAGKPVGAFKAFMTKERHVIPRRNPDSFVHKSRSIVPSYFRKSWQELKLVTWPGRKETWRLVFAVFSFALVMGVTIAVLDYGLEKLLREVIL